VTVGVGVGIVDGAVDGFLVGSTVGIVEGSTVGHGVVGAAVGRTVGWSELGAIDGNSVLKVSSMQYMPSVIVEKDLPSKTSHLAKSGGN